MRATSSIDRTKASMGYKNPHQRPCCHNCHYSQQAARTGAYNDMWPRRCTKGGFGVSANAVCNEHQPFQKGGAACPA